MQALQLRLLLLGVGLVFLLHHADAGERTTRQTPLEAQSMNHSLKTLCPCRYNILRRCEVADFVPEIWQVADFSCEICRNYQKRSFTAEPFDRR